MNQFDVLLASADFDMLSETNNLIALLAFSPCTIGCQTTSVKKVQQQVDDQIQSPPRTNHSTKHRQNPPPSFTEPNTGNIYTRNGL